MKKLKPAYIIATFKILGGQIVLHGACTVTSELVFTNDPSSMRIWRSRQAAHQWLKYAPEYLAKRNTNPGAFVADTKQLGLDETWFDKSLDTKKPKR